MTRFKALMTAVIVVSFTATVAADAPKQDDDKGDVKKLQGTWQVIKLIDSNEKATPAEEAPRLKIELNGDHLIFRNDKGNRVKKMKYKGDAAKKPKAIDIIDIVGSVESEGIYKLDGEELTICFTDSRPGEKMAARPTQFKASKRDKYSLFVLKKVKKADHRPETEVGKKEKTKPDNEAIQGEWQVVSLVSDKGMSKEERERIKSYFWVFEKEKILLKLEMALKVVEVPYKLDTTKTPKTMDLTIPVGDRTQHVKCIYKLEDGGLAICMPLGQDKPRPTEFKAGEGSKCFIILLERKK